MPFFPTDSADRISALCRLGLFCLLLVLGSSVLAPLFSLGADWLHLGLSAHRVMDRTLLFCALLSLLALGLPWTRLWPRESHMGRKIGSGFIIAFVSSQAIFGLALALQAREFRSDPYLLHTLAVAIVAALLVPFLEESLFRGFFLRHLALIFPAPLALIVSALIFSLAHFLKAPAGLLLNHSWSGLTAWGQLGPGLYPFLSVEGLNLFLIGWILGWLYLQTGDLWLNYGLHGGWIFFLLLMNSLLPVTSHPPFRFLGGTYLLSSGYVSLVLLMLLFWLCRYFPAFKPVCSISASAP